MAGMPVVSRGRSDRAAAVSPPEFVGRGRELAGLAEALACPPALVLVEGRLYLPKARCGDKKRRDRAQVPVEVGCVTKTELGTAMAAGAVSGAVPFGWVAGGSGTGHAHAVSCVHGQAGDRRQDAPSLFGPVADPRETHRKGSVRNLTHAILRKCCVPDRAVGQRTWRSLTARPTRPRAAGEQIRPSQGRS